MVDTVVGSIVRYAAAQIVYFYTMHHSTWINRD